MKIDKFTPEDQQTARARGQFQRGLLGAFVGLIGLVIVLALCFALADTP